jgi:1,4-dihydroxy-2-naphthoyl-CoA synthase
MMSDRYAKYDKLKFDYPAERVLRITFDRPETFNSVDAETHTQMTDMWIDIDRDPDINAVIVTGAGKAFSAGGDFSLIESMIGNSHEIMKTWKEARNLVYNIINCNKPIIPRPAPAWSSESWPTCRSRARRPRSLTAIPVSASPPVMSPRSSGRCCAAWPRRNTI